jgi:hypothetical protein
MLLQNSKCTYLADLDAIPAPHLIAFLKTMRLSLPENTRVALLFTAKDPDIFLLSEEFSMLVYPLKGVRRTPSALLMSLPNLLRAIKKTKLTLEGVKNISEDYATDLDRASRMLEQHAVVRGKFAAKQGLWAWREERLRGHWEAALLRTGKLTKWTITLRT